MAEESKSENKSENKSESKSENKSVSYLGRWGQAKVYLGKHFRIFIYEKGWRMLPMSAAISLLVCLVAGGRMFVNMEGTEACAFAFVCVCIWNGFFNSIQVVCRERAIVKREHRSGLHISAYILSHMIYQAFLCALQAIISVLIYWYYGMKFPSTGVLTPFSLFEFILTLWIITYSADMMALMVSCMVRTTTAAMTVMPFLLIVQLVFAGVIFPMSSGLRSYASKATISRWGTNLICIESKYNELPSQSLFAAIWKFNDVEELKPLIKYLNQKENRDKLDAYAASKRQSESYASTKSNVLKCWGILGGFALLYAFLGTISLEFVDKDKR